MKKPVRVTITGAAGHICYSIIFRIASGNMLGEDQPIIFQLLEIPSAMKSLKGLVMELEDCAYPLVSGIGATDNVNLAFKDADYAILIGAQPRGPGMERADLLEENAAIFSAQGKALNANAKKEAKILVVGNPANTNALITQKNAPNINPRNISSLMCLDHNRALHQLSNKMGAHTREIKNMVVWGNHSPTQYPDISFATIGGNAIKETIDANWNANEFIPVVQQRGAAVIKARGASSAASAASAAVDHMRSWILGTKNRWMSMGVYSAGNPYGIDEDLIYSFPVTCEGGAWKIVGGLAISDVSREYMKRTEEELIRERGIIRHLL